MIEYEIGSVMENVMKQLPYVTYRSFLLIFRTELSIYFGKFKLAGFIGSLNVGKNGVEIIRATNTTLYVFYDGKINL